MPFVLESPAFVDCAAIPTKFARAGQNVSPPLEWKGAPPGTRSFVVIVEDPDARSGIFRHWALYDIDPRRSSLPEGALIEAAHSGVNDFGHRQYDGPQPPKGHGVHHYHFRLAALDTGTLDVSRNARVSDVWKAATPHVLAEAELVGTFETR